MAKYEIEGLESTLIAFEQLAKFPEDLQDGILQEQADRLVYDLKLRGEGYGVYDTGKMLSSIKAGKVKDGKDGRQITVSPTGSRKRGKTRVRNAEIAFVQNYGTRHQPARPFWTDTIELTKMEMAKIAERRIDEWLKSLNL